MSRILQTIIYLVIFSVLGRAQNFLNYVQLKLYANTQYDYGVKGNVVISMTSYPFSPFLVRLSTAKYLLAYCETPSKMLTLKYTKNLSKVLRGLSIKAKERVVYEVAWYAVVQPTFWDSEDSKLSLVCTLPAYPNMDPIKRYVRIRIRLPTGCVPLLKIRLGADPGEPQMVVVYNPNMFRAYFAKSCGAEKKLVWKLMNLMETKLVKDYGEQNMVFMLQRYEMRFQADIELWRNLYVFVVEGMHQGRTYKARCYIKTVGDDVEAVIAGGLHRQVTRSQALIMDGTKSRDYAKSEKETQFKRYEWECQSLDDFHNKQCRAKMYTVGMLVIPPNTLTLGCRYKFILRVVSDTNSHAVARQSQMVTIVEWEHLQVSITCIYNCANNLYNPTVSVKLSSVCYNCVSPITSTTWFLDDQLILSGRDLELSMSTSRTRSHINVIIKTNDGFRGDSSMILMKNLPPIRGHCRVKPKSGIEAQTQFIICCENFSTSQHPIEFFYYAGDVLTNKCYTCKCISYLPRLSEIKVLVCDRLMTCREVIVPVSVSPLPNITIDTPEDLTNFITTKPNDLQAMIKHGSPGRFLQTIESLAHFVKNNDTAMVLMDALKNFKPQSVIMLGKLVNLLQTLAIKLSPIGPPDHEILLKVLEKVNENFGAIHENFLEPLLVQQPYINITKQCLTILKAMQTLNKILPLPPQNIYDEYINAFKHGKLNQTLVNKLLKDIDNFDDEEAKIRSQLWLNSAWQTQILHNYLGYAYKHNIAANLAPTLVHGVALEVQCFTIKKDFIYVIHTSDTIHIVYFSPELIQELKDANNDHICLKVLSIKRELNWWYPEEKQPSTLLLSVHIYVEKDNFKNEIKLHNSAISFRTVIGKYKPALQSRLLNALRLDKKLRGLYDDEDDAHAVADTGKYINCMENVTIKYWQDVFMFRINLEERAMLAIIFTMATQKLRVLPFTGPRPKRIREALAKSVCSVPAETKRTVILLRNKCYNEVQSAHIALQAFDGPKYNKGQATPIPNGPILVSFVFQVRSCDYWTYSSKNDSRHWAHDDCMPELEYEKKGYMHCTCTVLGTYTGYTYHVPAVLVPIAKFNRLKTNWILLIAFIIMLVLLLIWLFILYIWFNKENNKTVICDMKGLERKSEQDVHDLLVVLKTGGRPNALTTATVRLIFQTTMRTELQFTLMQDPEHPELTCNSSYILWLRSRDIRIPTRVAVAHNNAGRYPTWFLRRIEVTDIQAQLTQIFIVRRWVRQKFLILSSSMVLRPHDERNVDSWWGRFTFELEVQWVNWGLWQPLFGKWRDIKTSDTLTRFQRCCVFISKTMVIICVSACYLGPSTAETSSDRKISLHFYDVFIVFLICCVLTNLLQFIFVFVIVRCAQ